MRLFTCLSIALAISSFNCAKDGDGPDGDEGSIGTAKIGAACTSVTDCVAGLTECNDDPGGQCTKPCTADAECGAAAICETGGGNCYAKCTTNADCTRDGYACVGGEPGHQFCDPKHEVGDSCTTAADCATGLSICNGDPGGQCTQDCATDQDCAAVPGGAVCETGGGHCYKACATKADCPRDGYDCVGGPNEHGEMWCDVVGP